MSPENNNISAAAQSAARAIPPLWPLASSVAVNPFLGQSSASLSDTGALLGRMSGSAITMPRVWYREKLAAGEIADSDLVAAMEASAEPLCPSDLTELKTVLSADKPTSAALPVIAQLAADASGTDWPGIFTERFGAWAAGHFDAGQALWAAPKGKSAYAAWRAIAMHDLTPEIAGLTGFARFVADCPENADDVVRFCAKLLQLPEDASTLYFQRLLTVQGGWSQYARYILWQAEMVGDDDATLTDCLAIALVWEAALYRQYGEQIVEPWQNVMKQYAAPVKADLDMVVDAILQDAFERAGQRKLAHLLAQSAPERGSARPALQMAFCIDVRSEVFRRALEAQGPDIETIGFAGFFGLTASHHDFASDIAEHRLPVLLNAGLHSRSGDAQDHEADLAARYKARAIRAWGRFKLAAVSSFAFVEASGPIYIGKLVRDALGRTDRHVPAAPPPQITDALGLEDRSAMAATILRAMSLTGNFARLVVLAGHGATVANNPHHSGLNCGACGGYSGEVNARLLAALLNDMAVRSEIAGKGISIPDDTLFVAALHDTTTDRVTLYEQDHPAPGHHDDLNQLQSWLAAAARQANGERALRLPRANGASDILARSTDWSEIRPEWGLAGCSAFIAAPRARTSGKDFAGSAFLHDYDWRADEGFGVLELILTAPVVVASWINLQYYGSTVMPEQFGGGNKLLHNVVGGIGVIEGNGGNLRPGLAWQSIHDGDEYVHEPRRLTVCIEAPREAIIDILAKHEAVRELFDNGWLHLFALDDNGLMRWRYSGHLKWQQTKEAKNPDTLEILAA
ncbi:YbcC family protein [Parasphingorhabdus sp.]|uniref:YbcC family protein n=1 Tax=Parasphingorhabdus sp. TaxID=2709688 RepID=UPI0030021C7A